MNSLFLVVNNNKDKKVILFICKFKVKIDIINYVFKSGIRMKVKFFRCG